MVLQEWDMRRLCEQRFSRRFSDVRPDPDAKGQVHQFSAQIS